VPETKADPSSGNDGCDLSYCRPRDAATGESIKGSAATGCGGCSDADRDGDDFGPPKDNQGISGKRVNRRRRMTAR
jgi:hypothetical protein